MWLLIVSIYMAPAFEPITTQTRYLSEAHCVAARGRAVDVEAKDGVIVIASCKALKR